MSSKNSVKSGSTVLVGFRASQDLRRELRVEAAHADMSAAEFIKQAVLERLKAIKDGRQQETQAA